MTLNYAKLDSKGSLNAGFQQVPHSNFHNTVMEHSIFKFKEDKHFFFLKSFLKSSLPQKLHGADLFLVVKNNFENKTKKQKGQVLPDKILSIK